ncbi:metallophosphoesterase [Roseovarius phycicola]|uniref:Metallophosphoesterase n=1 Tax=Roseovarius phycicola TaxID=3080976 RepID=A0ABZ2HKB0_9RHOB
MLNALRIFLNKPDIERAPPAPDTPFVAIGDIHGRADLLTRLLPRLPDLPIICVGDYVDRGDHSADVLRLLLDRPEIICLSGNHEDMLLRFIDTPEREGGRWLLHGGMQTVASFGLGGISPSARGEELVKLRDALVEAMGQEMLTWLRDLPTLWQSGNVAVLHAGADPSKPLNTQKPQTLQWGHAGFLKTPRTDGMWVVHGHTVVEAPNAEDGRIAIDTGAYATGRLTAAIVEPGQVRFETA